MSNSCWQCVYSKCQLYRLCSVYTFKNLFKKKRSVNMNICRLCLSKGDDKEVLSVWDDQIDDFPNKIWLCVSIKVGINFLFLLK